MHNLTQIPFAQLIKLQNSQGEYLFELANETIYTNHLGTVAAAAQFSLAEFASGQWLLNNFTDLADNTIPMLRKSEVKFKTPGYGKIRAKASVADDLKQQTLNQLMQTKRALINIFVEVVDEQDKLIMQGHFEWYLQLKS